MHPVPFYLIILTIFQKVIVIQQIIENALFISWKNIIFVLIIHWKSVRKSNYLYWKSVRKSNYLYWKSVFCE